MFVLENLAFTCPYTDRPTFLPSAPQAYQCLISHILASLGACNLIVHPCFDQLTAVKTVYLLTSIAWPYRGLRYRLTEFECFFEGQVATFQMIAGSSSIFLKCIWNKSCSWAALLKCWFRTDLGRENSTGFYIYMQGRQSLLTFLTVTRWSRSTSNFYALIGQNLTGEFMRKIYAASGNLFTDSWSWQSFVSSCDVFNCLFVLRVQNEIPLLSRFFCNSWLVCLLRFWLRNAPLVKVHWKSDFGWHRFQKWA